MVSAPVAYDIEIDLAEAGDDLDIRRHGLGQGGFDDGPLTPPVIERVRALGPRTFRLFVQEYFRMLPSPGRYHWETIDAALRSVAATGARPLLSLCMKPGCLYPTIDHSITRPTDWAHWEQFITATVEHFRRDLTMPGLWYEISNEPDLGEPGGSPYLFTGEDYGEYYCRTVRAVLRGDGEAKVGGPALAGVSGERAQAIIHALARRARADKLPVDFFSWHGYRQSGEDLSELFQTARRCLAEAGEPLASAATSFNEWNIGTAPVQPGEFAQAAFVADAVSRMVEAGIDSSNYYHVMDMAVDLDKLRPWMSPGGLELMADVWHTAYRSLHMMTPAGEPTAAYTAFRMLYQLEGRRVCVPRPAPEVGVMAVRTDGGARLLVWNYHHERLVPVEVALRVAGLPARELTETHYALGAEFSRGERLRQMRGGELPLVESRGRPKGPTCARTLTVAPYSLHLLVVEL
ncbi:MAG TPA: hypothetical protein VNA25_09880 [Phycisphaerae bacterium]|nr:hypothetical protein [Phycisphaerae bacterium]